MPNPKEGKTRRVKERVVGTVIASTAHNKWQVLFDFDGKEQIVSSNTLKVLMHKLVFHLIETRR